MPSNLRPKLSYSNAIATIALFVALGGAAVAAGLPRHSVGTQQLKRGAVTSAILRKEAVNSAKLARRSVIAAKLAPNSVGPGAIGNGAVTSAKLGANSVIAASIKNGVITNNKLGSGVVNTAKLADGSVTSAKLGSEVAPLLGTLRSGQTLRGVFDVGSTGPSEDLARSAVSYQFPLLNPPTVTVLKPGQTSANCGGLSGGAGQTPQATAGNLCVYITKEENLDATTPLSTENNLRLGFGLVAKAKAVTGPYYAYGQWAVTAP
jgi:hypothetical protein